VIVKSIEINFAWVHVAT